jgi:hypothetical protein
MKKISTQFGLIAGCLIVCLILIGINVQASYLKLITFCIFAGFVICIVAGIQQAAIKEDNSFQNLFGNGFRIAAVACLITIAAMVLGNILFPAYKINQMVAFEKELVQKNIAPEVIKQQVEITKRMFLPLKIGSISLMLMFTGLLFSAITAKAFSKKISSSNASN